MRRRVVLSAVLAVTLAVGAAAAAAVAGEAPEVRTETLRVAVKPEPDGRRVTLEATLYRPAAAAGRRLPSVLLAHGFGGSMADLADEATGLARSGYLVLAYTARGFGGSGGSIHLDAPDWEVDDAGRLLDLLAARPEALLDAPNDPRVGVAGASYGGALALLLAGTDPRVDAIAPRITWNDLRQALFPQFQTTAQTLRSPAEVAPVAEPGVFKKLWAGIFFTPSGAAQASTGEAPAAPGAPAAGGGAGPVADPDCGRFTPELCAAYQEVAVTGRPTQRILDLLAASSPARVLGRVAAPTLLVQGENDSLFPLSEADANARGIAAAGTPVKVVWYCGGHDAGGDDDEQADRLDRLTRTWFDRYLRRDGSTPDVRFEVSVPAAGISTANSAPTAVVRSAPVAPGLRDGGTVPTATVPLQGRPQQLAAPAGGSPAALTAVPGLGGLLGLAGSSGLGASSGGSGTSGGGTGLSALPGQVARFDSGPLPRGLPLLGGGRVTLRVAAVPAADGRAPTSATLFAQLLDVSPDGAATLPQQLVSPFRVTGLDATGTDVTVALPAVVRDLAAGHRLRLVVSTTDQAYALPAEPARYRVALAGDGALTLPVPPTVGGSGSALGPLLPAVLGLALAGLAVAGWRVQRRLSRRRAATAGSGTAGSGTAGSGTAGSAPDGAALPLVVRGLGKAYRDGFRAVSDVSFQVEPGWVLGLLGPNGAGKTTVLRMLMGLIRPSEGELRVFGHRVTPGAPVLSRVGAFVEGPGFLPHLSGRANLALYWQATGRPEADAHLAEALEIAGLGEDLERRVRTYSQGMRQRLAIAQAMLGLPDLLVLDEPTNGLDPPQIAEMREVLARYAATGRTVVVSSHLLAEVEQTCSHVVVMHRGRVVAGGPVAELIGAGGAVEIEVDDPARAARAAREVAGVAEVEQNGTVISVRLAGASRADVVRHLVQQGVAVERVASRRGLEQAFLALVGES